MLKLMKWNSINFLRNDYWLFIGMLACLALAALPENGRGYVNGTLMLTAALLGIVIFQVGIIIALTGCFRWLERDSNLLELSLPVSPWQTLFAKLFTAFVVNGLSSLFLLQLFAFLEKNSVGARNLLNLDMLKSFPGIVLLLMAIDCTILCAYLVAKKMRLKGGISVLVTSLLTLIIFGVALVAVTSLMMAAGALVLPTVSGQGILSIDGTLNILSMTIPAVVLLSTIVLEFAASGLLLKRWQ